MIETFNNSKESGEIITNDLLNDLKDDVDNTKEFKVYDDLKDFNFDSILSFWKDGISFKPGQEKQNQKWTYININGINFYNSKNSDGSVPKDWYVYYMSKNLLYLSEIKDWKFFWDWLQINRDKDITRIKQVY